VKVLDYVIPAARRVSVKSGIYIEQESSTQHTHMHTGLDEAILGGGGGDEGGGNPEEDAARLASLLANGAHGLLGSSAGEALAARSDAFQSEGIEDILKSRTQKRQLGGRAGNTFSTAQFAADDVNAAFRTDVMPDDDEGGEAVAGEKLAVTCRGWIG
jgi:chromodomain-helicase-DNA-binding protein 7